METATYLLFLLGWLGAADIALFHSVAHGIRSHPHCTGELITHSLRGPTYAALFALIPNFALHGLFALGLLALFAFDAAISVCDFWLEKGSRRSLGGLPGGEYVLHMLMAMAFGGLVASATVHLLAWCHEPTEFLYAPAAVPGIVRAIMLVMGVLVLFSGLQDLLAVLRLNRIQTIKRSQFPVKTPSSGGKRVGTNEPPWLRVALVAAGIYNLAWGAWVVLLPEELFTWAGIAPINYPQIWQCVGMIIGVYGVGYLIAAQDPLRHWPIVAVGLLGKVFGPIGMLWSVKHGALPAGMAWICLGNDLVWWWPFALLLWHAYLRRERSDEQVAMTAPRKGEVAP
jgi:hypothetical protein